MTQHDRHYTSFEGFTRMMAWYDAALARLTTPIETLCVGTRYGDTHVIIANPHNNYTLPVVLLHGINTNAAVWSPQINRLNTFLVMPDVPGFAGKSAPVRLPYRGSAFADWLADVLDALSIERAVIVGSSAGAWFALKFASYYPARAAALLLLNPVGVAPYRHIYRLTQLSWVVRLAHLLRPLVANRGTARYVVERSMTRRANARNIELAYLLLRYFKRHAAPPRLPDADLQRVTAPVVLLVGQYEIYTDPHAVTARAVRTLPNLVHVECVPNVGHDINKEAPDKVSWIIQSLVIE